MQQRRPYIPVFLISLVVVLVLFILGNSNLLNGVSSTAQRLLFPIGNILGRPFSALGALGDNKEVESLRAENLFLSTKLAAYENTISDNKALRDQFATTSPVSQTLLPANIIGSPNTFFNISFPSNIILNKGEGDKVIVGEGVVYKDNIVGKIDSVSLSYSKVSLVTSSTSRFAGKDAATGALGIVVGNGNTMVFGNVILSDTLRIGDIIVAKGDQDISGIGYAPNLVVGKIIAVNKNPSALFQSAEVKSLLQLDRLSTVFVLIK